MARTDRIMTHPPATDLPSTEEIVERLTTVRERIATVRSSDREVTVVAVTKGFPARLIERALQAGLVDIGENYAQELEAKIGELGQRDGLSNERVRWHFVGGLQRNKIKMLGRQVDVWQTIDRMSLVNELAKRCPGATMLVQVNTTDEAQKSGCSPDDVGELVDRAREAELTVVGLMTVGPTDGSDPRPAFEQLRNLAETNDLDELSMGMSGDFEQAVQLGATMVRLGTVLFGPRPR